MVTLRKHYCLENTNIKWLLDLYILGKDAVLDRLISLFKEVNLEGKGSASILQ